MQASSTGGDSSCSWVFVRALGHNLGRKYRRHLQLPTGGEVRAKGNTPDFMLEYFIVPHSDDTVVTPHRWEVTLASRNTAESSMITHITGQQLNPAMKTAKLGNEFTLEIMLHYCHLL